MTILEETSRPAASLGVAERWLPALLLLFVGSGCAALVYEVVWFQLLQLSIGSSAVSLGVLLGVYMGGMCLGSLLLPRYLSPGSHPLRVYALLEVGIGVFGVIVLYAVPLIGSWYTAIAGSGPANLILRAAVAGICLIPPTLLMGATLPAIARWVETTPRGVSWLGFFYGGNLAGAVAGSLLAGFYLLRVYDMPTATFVAVAINMVVALLALGLAKLTPRTVITGDGSEVRPVAATTTETRLVYVAIALSGLTALGSEVVWTRVLSLIFGATAYTFSLILAVFLVGLGIGSSVGAGLAKSARNPREALGWCQVALCAALAWAGYATGASLPYWPINPSISTSVVFTFQLDLVRAFWVMLPGAILWGASFPLALASVAVRGQDSARLVGGVYAANTVGAIVGALVTALALVGVVGSQITQQVLIGVAALSGLLLLGAAPGDKRGFRASMPALARVIIVAAAAGLFARVVPPLPGLLVAYGRYAATWVGQNEIIYVGEGVTASVAVSRTPSGTLNYHNAGKVQASSEPQDMRLQRMLGHITTLVPKNPTKVLVIGCGAGVTAGRGVGRSDGQGPDDRRDRAAGPARRLHLLRGAQLQRGGEPEGEGAPRRRAPLPAHYQREVRRRHLRPARPVGEGRRHALHARVLRRREVASESGRRGNAVRQLYESTEAAAKSEVATFLEAFPNGAVFANTVNGQGYDLVLFGQLENNASTWTPCRRGWPIRPTRRSRSRCARSDQLGRRAVRHLRRPPHGHGELAEGRADQHRREPEAAVSGRLGLNLYQSDAIYKAMSRESKYPEELFAGSPDTLEALKSRITAQLGGASF
jgi:spermidine synthase